MNTEKRSLATVVNAKLDALGIECADTLSKVRRYSEQELTLDEVIYFMESDYVQIIRRRSIGYQMLIDNIIAANNKQIQVYMKLNY
mgnify:FL=1